MITSTIKLWALPVFVLKTKVWNLYIMYNLYKPVLNLIKSKLKYNTEHLYQRSDLHTVGCDKTVDYWRITFDTFDFKRKSACVCFSFSLLVFLSQLPCSHVCWKGGEEAKKRIDGIQRIIVHSKREKNRPRWEVKQQKDRNSRIESS